MVLLFYFVFWIPTQTQELRIVQPPVKLPIPFARLAKISPTGDRISFTGNAFNKLYVADLDGKNIVELCPHAAVGWGHQWSPDGKFIAVRANHFPQNTKRVRVEILDLEKHTEIPATDLLSPRSRLSLPEWNSDNLITYSTRAGLETKRIELNDSAVSVVVVAQQDVSLRRWSSDALEMRDSAKLQRVRPFRQARQVLNAVWTSDRRLSAVEFAGRPSLYVVTEDGRTATLIDPKGESPCWFDDQYIVYMVTEDDGHRILSSTIWIADKEGKMKKNLTEGFNDIALYPSAARNGTIVFTTESGAVYTMKIAVE
jgi:Tol biopolymer transport system component